MNKIERIGIVLNPSSGSGKGASFASSISEYLLTKGLKVRSRESSRGWNQQDILEFLSAIELLIIVGGDGTFRSLIPFIIKANIPVVLFPAGNESLISKKFNITTSIPDLYQKILSCNVEKNYISFCNDIPFFLMASVGFDAEVVYQVSKIRNSTSSSFLYIRAFFQALSIYKKAKVLIKAYKTKSYNSAREEVDVLIPYLKNKFNSSFIVANSPFYARKFLPVPEANSRHDEFCIRFFMNSSFKEKLNWFRSGILNKPLSLEDSSVLYLTELDIQLVNEKAVQLDGDYIGHFKELKFKKSESEIAFLV